MKQTRFTETQIVSTLKQQEAGRTVKDICREHAISDATFYNWKTNKGDKACQRQALIFIKHFCLVNKRKKLSCLISVLQSPIQYKCQPYSCT